MYSRKTLKIPKV